MIRTEDGKDIVEELRDLQKYHDTSESECKLLERAIAEIQFLRGMAGAVTKGESFGEIKKRTAVTIDELEAILAERDVAVKINPDGTVG